MAARLNESNQATHLHESPHSPQFRSHDGSRACRGGGRFSKRHCVRPIASSGSARRVRHARSANPPREQWKAPRQRAAGETDAAFKRFAEYVDRIRAIPGVRWITASDLPTLYPDLVRSEGATQDDLNELARLQAWTLKPATTQPQP